MYFEEYLKQYDGKSIKLFVDIDGVFAEYIFGSAENYDKKRPLFDRIKKLEKISKKSNVELFVFSASRYSDGIEQKHWWLDRYAPFFKKENRIIISREANGMEKSAVLKAKFLENYERDGSVMIVIDDDPRNLYAINDLNKDIILLKDSVLSD